MKKIIFILLLLLVPFFKNHTFSQENAIKNVVKGKVIDKETKSPLPFVNVWLEGTTFGSATDTLGNFSIENVPVGRYNICAKTLGYYQATIPDIFVISKKITFVNFELSVQINELSGITIKPEAFSRNSSLGVSSMNSINNQEIRKTPGVPDLFRRLQSIAGIGRSSDFSPALVVRGSDPEENLTYIEGIQIYSPFHFSNLGGTAMTDGMSIIEPKLVQNVDIITGGFNVKYGDGLSSVTEITLLEPEKRKLGGSVSLDMGGVSANLSGTVNKKLSWMWGGRVGMWEMFMEMQNRDVHPTTKDSHLKVIFEPSQKHKFTIYGLYVLDNFWRTKEDSSLELINEEKYRKLSKEISALGVNWRWLYSKKGYLSVTPYINTNNWDITEGPLIDKEKIGYINMENFYGLKSEFLHRINLRNRIMIGGELRLIETKYSKWSDTDTLRTGIIMPPTNITFGTAYSHKYSLFANYFYSPKNWLTITGGVRQDYFQFIDKYSFSPRIAASIDVTDKIRANAACGSYTQFPPFYKIFLSPQNKSLELSKAIHYIVGLEYLLSTDLQLKAEGYYKDLSDLPVLLNDTSSVYKSTGTGSSKGIEITLTQKMSKNLYLLFNYTLSKSTRKDSTGGILHPFSYDAPHNFNIIATYKHNNWWEFSLISRYSSGFPYTPYDISTRQQIGNTWVCQYGERNSKRLPDYYRLDIRVDRKFIFKNWNLSLFLEAWNITNCKNLMRYEYNFDFTKLEEIPTMFRIMPMFGVLAEF